MSENAILWKLGFGAMVLAISLLSLLIRTPPETVLEPLVVSPRVPPAAIAATRPPAQMPIVARATAKRRPAAPATVVAVREPRGAIVRTAARSRPVRPQSPYASGRQHYPFDPRHRWSGEQPP